MLAKLFKQYYKKISPNALNVRDFEKREFAYMPFNKQTMIRHLSFTSPEQLKSLLEKETPLHVYYSSAYYENPSAPEMEEKNWLAADLVFDIDADHIYTPCKERHDTWRCLDCGHADKGMAPDKCPKCGSKKIDSESWVCDQCLEVAKGEALKLIEDFLSNDLGFSIKEMEIVFSGHRGFHVHVESPSALTLDVDARRELADYVRGLGIGLNFHGFSKVSNLLIGPSISDSGWRGRLARGFYDFLSKVDEETLLKLKMPKKWVKYFMDNRERIMAGLLQNPPYWSWLKISPSSLDKILSKAVECVACKIDERVTIDIKRLMRLPNSLHGKTGLIAVKIPYTKLDSFEPFKEASLLRGEVVKLKVIRMPEIKLGGVSIGPYKDEVVKLPIEIAIYLLAKGVGEPIEGIEL
ncbi:MAG: hypothetical protein DRJ31_01930 [Candidatus Methanomethylicota archaeon]|uniref:DNA primase small subunit PriS n=1 Tax=Thermoproteota archaeon TaxID=2056631 RepID=A0A497ETN9_9CREN|nr:MAG: hypothetical protein DRJ31_01930 [Candidatus Verstraetearchaeota archaeon]